MFRRVLYSIWLRNEFTVCSSEFQSESTWKGFVKIELHWSRGLGIDSEVARYNAVSRGRVTRAIFTNW